MCSGALVIVGIQRVYFGLTDPKMGCLGGASNSAQLPESNHKFEAIGGLMEAENHALLNAFFKRNGGKESGQAKGQGLTVLTAGLRYPQSRFDSLPPLLQTESSFYA